MLALSTSRQRDERRIIFCGNRLHPDRVRPTGLGCRGSGYRLADHIGLGSRGASQVMHVPSGPAPRISFKSVRDWERLRARGEGEGDRSLTLCLSRPQRETRLAGNGIILLKRRKMPETIRRHARKTARLPKGARRCCQKSSSCCSRPSAASRPTSASSARRRTSRSPSRNVSAAERDAALGCNAWRVAAARQPLKQEACPNKKARHEGGLLLRSPSGSEVEVHADLA
jgi:hypothetical protein